MPSPEQQSWVEITAAPAAVASERSTGLPAELTVAQAVTESQWGARAPGNNYFGIKAGSSRPKTQLLSTTEWFTDEELLRFLARGSGRTAVVKDPNGAPDAQGRRLYAVKDLFAAYNSAEDCFRDHARLITEGKPYAACWAQYQADHNFDVLINGIAPIYSTSPGYSKVILKLAHSPVVTIPVQRVRQQLDAN